MQDQLPQRDQTALVMNGGSPPRLGRDELADAGDLAAGKGDQGQLFFEVAVVVSDGLGVVLRISAQQLQRVRAALTWWRVLALLMAGLWAATVLWIIFGRR